MNAMRLSPIGTRVTDHRPVAYFTVRLDVGRESTGNPAFSGTVERLGTGDKRRFFGAEELVRLLSQWRSAMVAPASAKERGDAH